MNFDRLISSPEQSISSIATKIECKFYGNLARYLKKNLNENPEKKINNDQINQIYKLLLDKCIN